MLFRSAEDSFTCRTSRQGSPLHPPPAALCRRSVSPSATRRPPCQAPPATLCGRSGSSQAGAVAGGLLHLPDKPAGVSSASAPCGLAPERAIRPCTRRIGVIDPVATVLPSQGMVPWPPRNREHTARQGLRALPSLPRCTDPQQRCGKSLDFSQNRWLSRAQNPSGIPLHPTLHRLKFFFAPKFSCRKTSTSKNHTSRLDTLPSIDILTESGRKKLSGGAGQAANWD